MKISGDFQKGHGLYLKGYVGAELIENRWRQVTTNREAYEKDMQKINGEGLSIDSWQVTLRNQIGDSQASGDPLLWNSGKLKVKNLSFGHGNYVAPYYPTIGFDTEQGKVKIANPGMEYSMDYFTELCSNMRKHLSADKFNIAKNTYWITSEGHRKDLEDFAKKYFCVVPEGTDAAISRYQQYLESQNNLLTKYKSGAASEYELVEATRDYIMIDTDYTLSPGKTPSDKNFVNYFLE